MGWVGLRSTDFKIVSSAKISGPFKDDLDQQLLEASSSQTHTGKGIIQVGEPKINTNCNLIQI
jgi:hypothetical protein